MNEVIREFLIETHENLAQLDLDLVSLEKAPTERETLSRVFRTFHTVKGTAGFLGLARLQAVAHAAENLLSRLRDGELDFNPEIASAMLAAVDAVRRMLEHVEAGESDGSDDFGALIQTLERLREPRVQGQGERGEKGGTSDDENQSKTVIQSGRDIAAQREPDFDAIQSLAAPPAPRAAPSPSLAAVEPEARSSAVSDSSIRVDVGLLDKLMTLVGELVLARNQILQFSAADASTPYGGAAQRLDLLTTELQAGVMKTRMQPIGSLWSKFPRVVRDLAIACGKQARIDLDGQETELDKTILEAIRDPLTHLVRNAVDHGLESPSQRQARGKPAEGRLALSAFHEGGKVHIEIADDGAGIDPQRVRAKAIQARLVTADQADHMSDRDLVNLIFLPGFSTAEKVTQFSGRGVGMDVVRTNIEKIGGTVAIDSRLGHGTTVKMKIPLTLAIIPALTVTSGGDRYAIPQVSLLELVRLEGAQAQRGIESIQGAPVYRLRGNLLPLVFLEQVLRGGEPMTGSADAAHIVVLQAEDRQFGLVVDGIHDTEEIVVKPLQKQVKAVGVFAGATIMGDGRVALILDVLGLAQKANLVSGVRERALTEKPPSAIGPTVELQTVLLFATADGGRMALPLSQVARLEEFPRSALERVGPQYVVQYRNEILPLIHVSRAMRGRRDAGRRRRTASPLVPRPSPLLQVVVYAGKNRRVGLVVDEILDIAEAAIVSRGPAHRPGVLFTAVIQGRVAEFLDVEYLLGAMEPELIEPTQKIGAGA